MAGSGALADRRRHEVVAKFVQIVWREGDLSRLPEFWTETCANHAAPAGQQRGLAALRAYHERFAAAFTAFSDANIEIVQQVAEHDRVASHIVTTGTHTGGFFGSAPTGRAVSSTSMRFDRLEDNRIAEHWSVADMAGLMQLQA